MQSLFVVCFFFFPPFGRRESRITLCQPEKYFLCLSSPSSKPKIINYSHSFALILFDCGLLLWRAFRNVPPGKFGLCGSRCLFWGAQGRQPWCLNLPWVRFCCAPVPCLALLPLDQGWHLGECGEVECGVPFQGGLLQGGRWFFIQSELSAAAGPPSSAADGHRGSLPVWSGSWFYADCA